MASLAELLQSKQVHTSKQSKSARKLEEWEAKSLGISIEAYDFYKKAYAETYAIVTDTFEKGYRMPQYRRKITWADCGNY